MVNATLPALQYIKACDPTQVLAEQALDLSQPYLDLDQHQLYLHDPTQGFGFSIDFTRGDILNRINPLTATCDVVKAVEGKNKDPLIIADLTAGLGTDSFTFASRGHQVYAIEQNTLIYWLLHDGLMRAKQDPSSPAHRITLWHGNNINFIDKLSKLDIDVIYLDPMFPERKKSAKVKKNMQLLHQVVGHQISSDDALLAYILEIKPCKKLIVKRPAKGEFLNQVKPTAQRIGKSSRFDIYAL